MAFVYTKPRWQQPLKKNSQKLGPGSYFVNQDDTNKNNKTYEDFNHKIKYGYISPQRMATTASTTTYNYSHKNKKQYFRKSQEIQKSINHDNFNNNNRASQKYTIQKQGLNSHQHQQQYNYENLQIILKQSFKQKKRDCGSTKGYKGKLKKRSPTAITKFIRGSQDKENNKQNQNNLNNINNNVNLNKILAKNTNPNQRYLHTSQSHKRNKKRRQDIMKIMIRKQQVPSLCKDNHQQLCIQNQNERIYQKNKTKIGKNKSRLLESRNKMSRISHSYTLLTKSAEEKNSLANNFMIKSSKIGSDQILTEIKGVLNGANININEKENSQSINNFITISPRKIKTSKINYRNYKNINNTLCKINHESFPYKMNQEGPTGIQDDSEDSIQYIDDATPGPGSYNLTQSFSTANSKNNYKQNFVGKFGVTVKRFENAKQSNQTYFTAKQPNFKKSSKAPQQFVAFGSSIKQEHQKQPIEIQFFADKKSLQYKSCQNLLKSYYSPGFFLSKEQRFPIKRVEEYYGPDFYTEDDRQQNEAEQEDNQNGNINISMKPQANFISKVKRIQKNHIQTLQVDYSGQDFYTIQKRLRQKAKQNQDIQRKPAAFLKDQPRFNQNQKHLLINQESFKPIHQILKKRMKQAETPKGYTFRKGQYQYIQDFVVIKNDCPDAVKYVNNPSWIKPSFNRKFQNLQA